MASVIIIVQAVSTAFFFIRAGVDAGRLLIGRPVNRPWVILDCAGPRPCKAGAETLRERPLKAALRATGPSMRANGWMEVQFPVTNDE